MEIKKKIGLVVAIEMDSLIKKYGESQQIIEKNGFTVRVLNGENYELYVVDSGAGEISAAMSTQFLICEFNVDIIFNFGVVGGLTEEMKTTSLCVIEKIIHYDFVTTGWLNLPIGKYPNNDSIYFDTDENLLNYAVLVEPRLKKVVCASADKFVDDPQVKQKLHSDFGADICEMESAGIAITCKRNKVPCLFIKCVSDSLTGGGKEFFEELEKASSMCIDIVDKIIYSMCE